MSNIADSPSTQMQHLVQKHKSSMRNTQQILLCWWVASLALFPIQTLIGQSFSYDLGGRLTSAQYSDGSKVNYVYDSGNNISSISSNAFAADMTPPGVSISSPADGSSVSSFVIVVAGNASDDSEVAAVFCQLNSGVWKAVNTTDAWAHWSTVLTLVYGTNVLNACAVDAAGNTSVTNTVRVLYPASMPISVVFDDGFGVRTNSFGFNLTGLFGQSVVIEACTNLGIPNWMPLETNTFGSGALYFSDASWTNYPGRFYRVRSQ